jgi:hypothetical protein
MWQLSEIVKWTNYHRDQNGGLPPLTRNPLLDTIANFKAHDMASKQYFDHEAPDGTDPAELALSFGYDYSLIGENINYSSSWNTESDILTQWMNSPLHRAAILNTTFLEIGVGVATGFYDGRVVWFAVQTFGLEKGGSVFYTGDVQLFAASSIYGQTINIDVFLRKSLITDEEYALTCSRVGYTFKPRPCVIRKSLLQPIEIPILYDTEINPVTLEQNRIVKFGLKRFTSPCANLLINIGLAPGEWEPWDGTKDNMCVNHTWFAGMADSQMLRHERGECDGSFTLAPPDYESFPVPDPSSIHYVTVTDLYWLELEGGVLTSSMWKEPAGASDESGWWISYTSSYMEWQHAWDTVDPGVHIGARNIRFDIDTEFIGFPEGSYFPNWGYIAVQLIDANDNVAFLVFRGDDDLVAAVGGSEYLVGDGIVDIKFEDWGLDSDLRQLIIFNYSDFLWEEGNYDRKQVYNCRSIHLY